MRAHAIAGNRRARARLYRGWIRGAADGWRFELLHRKLRGAVGGLAHLRALGHVSGDRITAGLQAAGIDSGGGTRAAHRQALSAPAIRGRLLRIQVRRGSRNRDLLAWEHRCRIDPAGILHRRRRGDAAEVEQQSCAESNTVNIGAATDLLLVAKIRMPIFVVGLENSPCNAMSPEGQVVIHAGSGGQRRTPGINVLRLLARTGNVWPSEANTSRQPVNKDGHAFGRVAEDDSSLRRMRSVVRPVRMVGVLDLAAHITIEVVSETPDRAVVDGRVIKRLIRPTCLGRVHGPMGGDIGIPGEDVNTGCILIRRGSGRCRRRLAQNHRCSSQHGAAGQQDSAPGAERTKMHASILRKFTDDC